MKTLNAAMLAILILSAPALLRADDDGGLPKGPFDASHYRILWETSPFAVASPVAVESVQYSLVGAAEFEGISYASVIDKQSQNDHFVVTSKTPSHGLSLINLVHGTTPGSTYATLQTSDGILKLTLDTTAPPAANPGAQINGPPINTPAVMMQGGNPLLPPLFRRHPHPAHVFVPPIYVPRPPPTPPPSQ